MTRHLQHAPTVLRAANAQPGAAEPGAARPEAKRPGAARPGATRPAIAGALALLSVLGWAGGCTAPESVATDELRMVSYNIRYGRGTDEVLDLERTARILADLKPHVIGLQEVDRGVTRSEGVNQADSLAALLEMQAAFEAFMPYQGGEYGMAILTDLPIVRSRPIPLPPGDSEPRVALAVDLVLPAGDTIVVINVHFDWIRDDRHRFAQASVLSAVLDTLAHPWVLLGDLNDEPGSRTVELFRTRGLVAEKSPVESLTYPSPAPEREIDHLFAAPREGWVIPEIRVIDEREASDHRPVLAVLRRLRAGRRGPR